jgi:nicotinamidase-related amidase
MAATGWEQDPIAFADLAVGLLALDAQARGASDDKYPLIGFLVVPLALGRRLTRGHDALDAEARTIDKHVHELIGELPRWQIAPKVAGLDHGQSLAQALPGLAADAEMPEKQVMPGEPLTRDRPIRKGRAALLIVDMQNGTCGPAQAKSKPEFHEAASTRVIPNIRRLLDAFRRAGLEVIFTVIENLTEDGRDRSLDYKLSGFNIAKGSWEAHVVEAIAPQQDEIVLPKTSSSAFNSTNLDYLLRNIGIEDVFVAGFLTDQCIDHLVKDGADRGYYMTCVHDACAAETEARHEAALQCFKGYCRMLTTDEVIARCSAP